MLSADLTKKSVLFQFIDQYVKNASKTHPLSSPYVT